MNRSFGQTYKRTEVLDYFVGQKPRGISDPSKYEVILLFQMKPGLQFPTMTVGLMMTRFHILVRVTKEICFHKRQFGDARSFCFRQKDPFVHL